MNKKRQKSAPKAGRAASENPQDGPTREWRRHHDATRTSETHTWVRRSRVQQIYDAGMIGRDEVDAAKRYLDDYEIGVAGAHVGSGGGSGGLYADGRFGALTRYREAREAVGADGRLLDALVVRDASWDELARTIGRKSGGAGRGVAKEAAMRALGALSAHYGRLRPVSRRAAAPPAEAA